MCAYVCVHVYVCTLVYVCIRVWLIHMPQIVQDRSAQSCFISPMCNDILLFFNPLHVSLFLLLIIVTSWSQSGSCNLNPR